MRGYREAQVPCSGCGAGLPRTPFVTLAACPKCNTPAEAPADAHEAERGLAKLQDLAIQPSELDERAALEDLYAPPWPQYLGIFPPLVFPVLAVAMTPADDVLMLYAGAVAFAVGLACTYLVWTMTRRRASTVPLQVTGVVVECPACTQRLLYGGARATLSCTACDARLTATAALVNRAQADARAIVRGARAVQERATRAVIAAATSGGGRGSLAPYLGYGGGSVAFAIGGVVLALDPGFRIHGDAAWSAFAMSFGCALALVVVTLHRQPRKDGWERFAMRVVTSLGGDALPPVHGTMRWLNAHWEDATPPRLLSPGLYYQSIGFRVGGYAGLVVVDPLRDGEDVEQDMASVYVAARLDEGVPLDASTVARARSALEQEGFSLATGPSGFVAEARPDVVRRFASRGSDGASVVRVARELVRCAKAVGAPASA